VERNSLPNSLSFLSNIPYIFLLPVSQFVTDFWVLCFSLFLTPIVERIERMVNSPIGHTILYNNNTCNGIIIIFKIVVYIVVKIVEGNIYIKIYLKIPNSNCGEK
jgi:hypothetical protein